MSHYSLLKKKKIAHWFLIVRFVCQPSLDNHWPCVTILSPLGALLFRVYGGCNVISPPIRMRHSLAQLVIYTPCTGPVKEGLDQLSEHRSELGCSISTGLVRHSTIDTNVKWTEVVPALKLPQQRFPNESCWLTRRLQDEPSYYNRRTVLIQNFFSVSILEDAEKCQVL